MERLEVDLDSDISRDSVIALGNFDGIHRGHRALLDEGIAMAKELGCPSSVLLFKTHTNNLTEGISQELITSRSQKHELIDDAGIDILYEMVFDQDIMKLSPEAFLKDFLVEHLRVRGIVVGYDYRFGFKAAGDVPLLRAFCKTSGIRLVVKEAVTWEGGVISSTDIRRLIKEGKPRQAHRLLGRPFSIRGKVVKGKQLGRQIGIPTANLLFNTHYVIPRFGVYLARVHVDGKFYYAATNVGTNPTFNEQDIKVESYLYDFEGYELYGKMMDVELLEFLRPERAFENIEELKRQMDRDLAILAEQIRDKEFTNQ